MKKSPKQPPQPAPEPDLSPKSVARAASGAGFPLPPDAARGLADYLGLLLKWNRSMNLVGRSSWSEIFADLILDSLRLAGFLAELPLPEAPRCLDLGSGAGLPGIPLRLVWTPGTCLLVEPRERRAAFLRTAVGLVLPGGATRVFEGRVEDLPQAELPADLILSRAFAPWPEYLALARPCLSTRGAGGHVVVLASGPPPDAGELAQKAPGFVLAAARAYPAPGGERYFWGLAPASISR